MWRSTFVLDVYKDLGQTILSVSCNISKVRVRTVTRIAYVAQKRSALPCHISRYSRSQARTGLTSFIYFIVSPYYKSLDMTTTEENKDEKKKDIKRTKRLEARVTEKEYAKAVELAETCGLTLSDYIRKCALGQHPRRRLTDKEVEALCSLSDARGALMRIAAAVKSIQGSHRAQYFADTRFVEQWMRAAIPLMARWNEIQEYITQ